jgi:hypothetical protein
MNSKLFFLSVWTMYRTQKDSLSLDQQLQEDDIGATARKDDKYRRYGFCVHRG